MDPTPISAQRPGARHTGSILFCGVLVLLALGFGQWAVANRQHFEWMRSNGAITKLSTQHVQVLWILTWSNIGWMSLSFVFVNAPPDKAVGSGLAKVNFGLLVRRRLVEGFPIRPGLLRTYGCFGIIGLLLATGLSLRLVHGYTWLRSIEVFQRELDVGLPLVALAVFRIAGQLIWSVRDIAGWQPVDEQESRQVAAGVLEEEREEAEAEREERRTSVAGWPYAMFLLFFLGGILFGSRLAETQVASALIIGLSGFEFSALTLYIGRTRPGGRTLWHVVVSAITVAGVIWGWSLAVKPGWFMAVAFVWGIVFGFLLAVAYLKKLKRFPTRPH